MRHEDVMSEFMMAMLNSLNDIVGEPDLSDYAPLHNHERLLLMNNGCRMSNEDEQLQKIIVLDPEYEIMFVSGALGNDKNTYFDFYVEHHNIKVLVVFLDYFNNIKTKPDDEYDENGIRDDLIGHSNEFFAIKTITEIFMESFFGVMCISSNFNATVLGSSYRITPSIVAGFILNYFRPLTENDVDGSGIDYRIIIDTLTNPAINIKDKLAGIRVSE